MTIVDIHGSVYVLACLIIVQQLRYVLAHNLYSWIIFAVPYEQNVCFKHDHGGGRENGVKLCNSRDQTIEECIGIIDTGIDNQYKAK